MWKYFSLFLLFLIIVPLALATVQDPFRPYIHKASVPESPKLQVFGDYETLLFPGAATYTYPLIFPKGTNNLQPPLQLTYNSQLMKQRPSVVGAGWSLTDNSILRNINFTPGNISDDYFIVSLEGSMHKLTYSPSERLWHTAQETFMRVENKSGAAHGNNTYWLITRKDGKKYRFGYNSDSELPSNTGKNYSVRWSLDRIEDTFGNSIHYTYLENPFFNDTGAVYVHSILYNNDSQRAVYFSYENNTRPDRRRVFEQGNELEETRRLIDISIFAEQELVRRYNFTYVTLNPALSTLSQIQDIGADNTSVWYALSFEYYLPEVGYKNETTEWEPPALFSDNSRTDFGVRLEDVNNDGFVDVVLGRASTSNNSIYINNKTNGWTLDNNWKLPYYIVDGSAQENGIRFGHVDDDGMIDLLRSRQGFAREVYLNNRSGWRNATANWTIPVNLVDDVGRDVGTQVVDITGEGRVDIIFAQNGNRHVYINNGSGWKNSTEWIFPTDLTNVDRDDQGVRLIDLNSDGLIDIFRSGYYSGKSTWLNNGTGFVNASYYDAPVVFTTITHDDAGIRFLDVNNDGLPDVIEAFYNGTATSSGAWLNTGRGWLRNDSWGSPEYFTSGGLNQGRRIADITGDGFGDIMVAQDSAAQQNSWTKNATFPYLLKKVVHEYGGMTAINYTTSTRFNNSDDLGFNVFVVLNVTTNNSMNGSFSSVGSVVTNYSFGKYDFAAQEFLGFGLAVEKKISGEVWHYFHQDIARKGKEYRTEVFDLNNSLFSAMSHEFVSVRSSVGSDNVTLRSTSSYTHDGNRTDPKVVNVTYAYDSFGNVIGKVELGEVAVVGDERLYNYSYALNKEYWIVDRISSAKTFDAVGNKVKDTLFYYDSLGYGGLGSNGALTKKEEWNNQGNNSFTYLEYDNYGNVKKQTDSLGNSQSYSYDSAHTYLVSSSNAVGHVTLYSYDLGTGNLQSTEKNGIKTSYEYDTFGRIVKEIQPLDSVHAPTKKYTYNLDGVAPENIVVELKNNANYTVVRYYYDGFAQLVQLKNDIEDSTQVVKNIFYDGLGRVKAEENPYFANTSSAISNLTDAANTTYSYDALDRVIGVRNPDGTTKNITYSRWNITDFDENGNRIQYMLDGFGQISNVTEHYNDPFIFINESYVTSYRYDTNGNLVKITDTLGNQFKFGYDSLNRKISMDDPDLGHWDYRYDQNGNLIRQNDSRNKPITLTYDALNRVIIKNSSDVNITFGYDQQYQGTLSNISMRTVNMTYKYDQRLRTTKETKIINGLTFETKFFYDSQNRVISKEGLSELDFIYNLQGKVQQIPNYIPEANYNAFGSILNRTYANTLIQNFSYNAQNNRLTTIRIPSVQNLAYTYDSVGNILTITDAQNNRDHTLTYDTLNRLITAKVGPDRFTYAYNPTGNILKIVRNNNESKKFVYNDLAHAPSQVVEGSAGIDVYHLQEINSTNKSRTVEFYLVNDQNQTVAVNYTVHFGDGSSFVNSSSTIVSDYLRASTNHTYATGGQYDINVSITSSGTNDQQQITPTFGLLAQNLTIISQNISNITFGFTIKNSMTNQMAENVSWNCSNGVRADAAVNLSGSQSVFNYVYYNFSRPGSFDFSCTGTSLDGTDSATAAVTVPGLVVENYNIVSENISQRIIGFEVKNYFHPLSTAINVTTEGASFVSSSFNLSTDQNVMAFVELNYTTDGVKTITLLASGQNVNTTSVQTIDLLPVTIENYQRLIENSTRKIFFFDVKNNWVNGTSIRWNITDPALNGTASLALNSSLMVMIEHNYTTQGVKAPVISAAALTAWDTVYDYFTIKPIELWQLNTLSDSQLGAVVELVIKNNMNHSQNFSWRFDSGVENITSTQNIQLQNSSPIFVYIGFNYSTAGVYGTNAVVNSSIFSDNQSGVVVN